MHILIVGNVVKDIYLNLDTRSSDFEQDKDGTDWLDLSFNASEHHFFNRCSSYGGAAITLEVLQKLGLDASISGSSFHFDESGPVPAASYRDHRYIMLSDDGVAYFTPKKHHSTSFVAPKNPVNFLYIDRSATLTPATIGKIHAFLAISPSTHLILYLKDSRDTSLTPLIQRASLIFYENSSPILSKIPQNRLIHISETTLTHQDITEPIIPDRVDRTTHLSLYSTATATILGSLALGNSVATSLKYARLNIENSILNSTLSLSELKKLAGSHTETDLELIAASLMAPQKGILAADESGGSIQKKFATLNIPDTAKNRHDYRDIFFTTKGIEDHLSGVILFDETARDTMKNSQTIPDFLISHRIIPGIKVDQGLESFPDSEETYTKGLDGLESRLREYYQMNLRFTKWRAAFNLTLDDHGNILTPSTHAITENSHILASYAKKCQSAGLVPIVEPELVYDGDYPLEKSAEATAKILDNLFATLSDFKVNLRACILKVNMVLAGKKYAIQSTPEEVGAATAKVLKEHVPKNLAGVVFLSGGQTPEQATKNLAAITAAAAAIELPFPLTFSFARALQDPALYAWAGDNNNAEKARADFFARLAENTKALK